MLERRKDKKESPHWVFPDSKGHQRKEVTTSFRRLVSKVGFNEGITDRRQKITFHSLRHTFCSWMALQGETLLTIKELVGHKTLVMAMRYTHLIPDQKRIALSKLESISLAPADRDNPDSSEKDGFTEKHNE